MLTYLDSLCDAMAARDLPRLRDLIDEHPLARVLPADAVAEVRRFLAAKIGMHTVPLAMLQFRDQTARLLNEAPRPDAAPAEPPSVAPHAPRRRHRRAATQTELPLSA